MANPDQTPTPSAAPAPDGAAVAADTADLLRRYLCGDSLTPKEFGKVGVHYRGLGQPTPKDVRSSAIEKRRIGTAVAASAILAEHPPVPDPVSAFAGSLPPSPAESADNAALLVDIVGTLLGTANEALRAKTQRVARKIGADSATVARMTEKPVISDRAKNLVCKPLPALAAKYGVGLDCVPEASLLAGLGEIGINVTTLLRELSELEALAAARHAKRETTPKETAE